MYSRFDQNQRDRAALHQGRRSSRRYESIIEGYVHQTPKVTLHVSYERIKLQDDIRNFTNSFYITIVES